MQTANDNKPWFFPNSVILTMACSSLNNFIYFHSDPNTVKFNMNPWRDFTTSYNFNVTQLAISLVARISIFLSIIQLFFLKFMVSYIGRLVNSCSNGRLVNPCSNGRLVNPCSNVQNNPLKLEIQTFYWS